MPGTPSRVDGCFPVNSSLSDLFSSVAERCNLAQVTIWEQELVQDNLRAEDG